jgi:hypothetical protein
VTAYPTNQEDDQLDFLYNGMRTKDHVLKYRLLAGSAPTTKNL